MSAVPLELMSVVKLTRKTSPDSPDTPSSTASKPNLTRPFDTAPSHDDPDKGVDASCG